MGGFARRLMAGGAVSCVVILVGCAEGSRDELLEGAGRSPATFSADLDEDGEEAVHDVTVLDTDPDPHASAEERSLGPGLVAGAPPIVLYLNGTGVTMAAGRTDCGWCTLEGRS